MVIFVIDKIFIPPIVNLQYTKQLLFIIWLDEFFSSSKQ